ncbi:MAG: hypothetical protein ACREPR_21370 [Brasilonema sp.]
MSLLSCTQLKTGIVRRSLQKGDRHKCQKLLLNQYSVFLLTF